MQNADEVEQFCWVSIDLRGTGRLHILNLVQGGGIYQFLLRLPQVKNVASHDKDQYLKMKTSTDKMSIQLQLDNYDISFCSFQRIAIHQRSRFFVQRSGTNHSQRQLNVHSPVANYSSGKKRKFQELFILRSIIWQSLAVQSLTFF